MRFFKRSEVERLLDLDKLIDAVAAAMADLSAGRASMPARTAARADDAGGLLGVMPAYLPSLGALTCKLVTLFPGNAGGTLPTHQALIACFDPSTGEPIAVMDGTYITAMRTAAASALSVRELARKDAVVLAILGTGVQARAHAVMVPKSRAIREIRVAGRSPEKAKAFAESIEAETGLRAIAAASWAEAVRGADIVCATVHPVDPVVRWEWLSPGAHVTSVGMSYEGRELDSGTLANARVFVDQRSAASSPMPTGSTDLFEAVRDGLIKLEDIAEIGEVLSGARPGRRSADEVTLYKSVGVAVQDAAAASLVLNASSG